MVKKTNKKKKYIKIFKNNKNTKKYKIKLLSKKGGSDIIIKNIRSPDIYNIDINNYTICLCDRALNIGDWFLSIFKFCNENTDSNILLIISERLIDIAYLFSDKIKYVITYNTEEYNDVDNFIKTNPFASKINTNFSRTTYILMLEGAKIKYNYKCIINKKFVTNLELINSIPNNSIICFPERSDNYTVNNDIYKIFLEKFYNTNKIYTNIIKDKSKTLYKNDNILENTNSINIGIFDLVYLCSIKNILIIGNRSGILDLLYFTCPNTPIINLVPPTPSGLEKYNFFDTQIFDNININHLKHNNGLDIILSNYDLNKYMNFIKNIFI